MFEGISLSSYTDASEIASLAKDAMTLFVKTGTVSGSGGNLNPADTTNRAQSAQAATDRCNDRAFNRVTQKRNGYNGVEVSI